jgi:hypothetical protein
VNPPPVNISIIVTYVAALPYWYPDCWVCLVASSEEEPMRMKKLTRSKKARTNLHARIMHAMRTMSTRTMVIGVLCFLGAAMVIGAATSDVRPEAAAPHAQSRPTASAAAATGAPAAAAANTDALPAAVIDTPVKVADAKAAPVTITGCLERDAESFRLKDTTGDNAPKSRSWKSGFLKKGSASVEVVDAPKSAKLPSHVGQRVSVTGVLSGREMQVRSVQRVGPSCSDRS